MIALAYDCLLFQTSNGESIPFSAEMISVDDRYADVEVLLDLTGRERFVLARRA